MLNRPLSKFYDDDIQRCREEMAITLLKHSGTYMQSKELYVAMATFLTNIFLYIAIVNLTNMCRLCGSHSDEEDKFWVSYIGNS